MDKKVREAIQLLDTISERHKDLTVDEMLALTTLLETVQKQEDINIWKEDYNYRCQLAIDRKIELEKKDKIIDEMAEMLEKFPNLYRPCLAARSKEGCKQYFKKKVEEKTMEPNEKEEITLQMTVDLMNSEEYKDRFKGEYAQTIIRLRKLNDMLNKYDEGTLDFTPTCPVYLLRNQAAYMLAYLKTLEERAEYENIDLSFAD